MFKKILVPLDGSELAEKILPHVEDLAKTHGAKVTLLTVGHYAAGAVALGARPEVIKEAAANEKRVSQRYLKKTASALKEKGLTVDSVYEEGVTVDWVYDEAIPGQAIVIYSEKHQFDLIAMSTHGKGEVAWVLGSVAEKVVSHATVPVLLLRVMDVKPPLLGLREQEG